MALWRQPTTPPAATARRIRVPAQQHRNHFMMHATGTDVYSRVRFRLAGRYTPIVRQRHSLGSKLPADNLGDEEELHDLFSEVTARAENSNDKEVLQRCDAWRRIVNLLPILARVQSLLLRAERTRCQYSEELRGRPTHVRFVCYDLSAIDLSPSSDGSSGLLGAAALDSARSSESELLHTLVELVVEQRCLLADCTSVSCRIALDALVAALRSAACSAATRRSQRVANWYANAFEALAHHGWPVLCTRLSELLGSLLRFHLHAVFDRPNRAQLRASERADVGRPRSHHTSTPAAAASLGRGNSLRFYVPRASASASAPASAGDGVGVESGSGSSSSVRGVGGGGGPLDAVPNHGGTRGSAGCKIGLTCSVGGTSEGPEPRRDCDMPVAASDAAGHSGPGSGSAASSHLDAAVVPLPHIATKAARVRVRVSPIGSTPIGSTPAGSAPIGSLPIGSSPASTLMPPNRWHIAVGPTPTARCLACRGKHRPHTCRKEGRPKSSTRLTNEESTREAVIHEAEASERDSGHARDAQVAEEPPNLETEVELAVDAAMTTEDVVDAAKVVAEALEPAVTPSTPAGDRTGALQRTDDAFSNSPGGGGLSGIRNDQRLAPSSSSSSLNACGFLCSTTASAERAVDAGVDTLIDALTTHEAQNATVVVVRAADETEVKFMEVTSGKAESLPPLERTAGATSEAAMALRRELANLELVDMPLPVEGSSLGASQHVSLGALLSRALALWDEHVELAQSASITETLAQRDLYARLSLKALHPSEQSDLLDWVCAHAVLTFITNDNLLERFASYSPSSWRELRAVSQLALRCGADEGGYALLTDPAKLRRVVADAAPVASKLLRHLTAVPVNVLAPLPRNGTRRRSDDSDDTSDAQRVRVVRVRHAGGVWRHDLDWEEISVIKEPSPGRGALRLAGLVPMLSRF